MIKLLEADSYKVRANGWVQDASDFNNLWNLVHAFDNECEFFIEAKGKVSKLVSEPCLKKALLDAMERKPLKYKYKEIVGNHTPGISRKFSVCNSIGQAVIKGQKREFSGDWPVDNFLRLLVVLDFVSYDMVDDSYSISEKGQQFSRENDEGRRIDLIQQQLTLYPPVRRIINILEEAACPLTKYQIGEKFGCVGEAGFTCVTQRLFNSLYINAENDSERKSLISNKEGSSDKYARQICSWLSKLGIVETIKPENNVIPPLGRYKLTPKGEYFKRSLDINHHINVLFSMLSMSKSEAELNKRRRALILYFVQERKISNVDGLLNKIKENGFEDYSEAYLFDDIQSMYNCGIEIKIDQLESKVKINNKIDKLFIPRKIPAIDHSSRIIEEIKSYLRPLLKNVDHNLLSLVDYSYSGTNGSRIFEDYTFQTFDTFTKAIRLGGSSRPDLIAEFGDVGLIVDSKAYSKGFSADRSLKDEMIRYVREAIEKPSNIVPKWWEQFSGNVRKYAFVFVSSSFGTNINDQLADIYNHSNVKGCAISAKNLLLLAELVKENRLSLSESLFATNSEISFD